MSPEVGWRRGLRRLGVCVAALCVGLVSVAACSDDSSDAGLPTPSSKAEATALKLPEPPPAGAAGTGTVVVGGTSSPFVVSSCALEPDPAQPEAARAQIEVVGTGESAVGGAFTVEIRRFSTTLAGVVTYTDNVSYSDSARILQAQRIEVGGQVTDLRDADATTALIRTRADGVSAAGLAGAPGDSADDEGIVTLAVNVTC